MAYGVSTLAVASYHCIMCILAMSICIEPGRWESHITILECSRARSVRKLYDYSGVLLWIMSPLPGRDRTSTASYIARGGVQCSCIPCWVWRQWTCICIVFALFWGLLVLKFYVGMKWRWGVLFFITRSITLFICGGVLFIVYHGHYMFMGISLDKYSYHEPLFIMTCILLWLNQCLIKQ